MKFIFCKTILILTLTSILSIFAFAQTERDRGIELYKRGRYSEAADVLKRASKQKAFKKDSEIWNFLGLAYLNGGSTKSGRKALEKAVGYAPQNSTVLSNLAYAYLLENKNNKAQSAIQKAIQLDPKNANAFYIRGVANLRENKNERAVDDAKLAIAVDPQFTSAYILQSDGFLAQFAEIWSEDGEPRENLNLLEQASETLNRCLSECDKDGNLQMVKERIETVKAFSEYFSRKKVEVDNTQIESDNRTGLKIISKLRPGYTDAARQNNVQGTIDLAVLFGADAKIKYVLVLKGLRYGLTEKAVSVAKSIEFEPETENGKPVSVIKVVQFSFTIY